MNDNYKAVYERPRKLLTQNGRFRGTNIYNWTIPAWAGRFRDGTTYNTCPSAGVCRHICYARNGAYRWPNVLAAHEARLWFATREPQAWKRAMIELIQRPSMAGCWIRIHDAGDFFSDEYTHDWLEIVRACPSTTFYAYTKEVDRWRRLVDPSPPGNLLRVYSLGGTQDGLLDFAVDRVADIFPTADAIEAEPGWHDQSADDRLAVIGPAQVGMATNGHKGPQKRQGNRRISEWQRAEDQQRRQRESRRLSTRTSDRTENLHTISLDRG